MSTLGISDPTIPNEKNALCDGYIVEFIHDATKNYYEGGIYAYRSCNNIKFPLYVLKVLKLSLFFLFFKNHARMRYTFIDLYNTSCASLKSFEYGFIECFMCFTYII